MADADGQWKTPAGKVQRMVALTSLSNDGRLWGYVVDGKLAAPPIKLARPSKGPITALMEFDE